MCPCPGVIMLNDFAHLSLPHVRVLRKKLLKKEAILDFYLRKVAKFKSRRKIGNFLSQIICVEFCETKKQLVFNSNDAAERGGRGRLCLNNGNFQIHLTEHREYLSKTFETRTFI